MKLLHKDVLLSGLKQCPSDSVQAPSYKCAEDIWCHHASISTIEESSLRKRIPNVLPKISLHLLFILMFQWFDGHSYHSCSEWSCQIPTRLSSPAVYVVTKQSQPRGHHHCKSVIKYSRLNLRGVKKIERIWDRMLDEIISNISALCLFMCTFMLNVASLFHSLCLLLIYFFCSFTKCIIQLIPLQ